MSVSNYLCLFKSINVSLLLSLLCFYCNCLKLGLFSSSVIKELTPPYLRSHCHLAVSRRHYSRLTSVIIVHTQIKMEGNLRHQFEDVSHRSPSSLSCNPSVSPGDGRPGWQIFIITTDVLQMFLQGFSSCSREHNEMEAEWNN